ncbi:MAG TPA: HEAT repeat domain-containing protein [Sphingobium sp.]|nr:HEAT repeat domain-containing protein [Sphingobium sp.]
MPADAIADHVAQIAILVSVYGALAMAALLLFLVMRRDRKERASVTTAELIRTLTREIMGAGDSVAAGPAFLKARPAERLAAISHLIQLLRGEDRYRLVTLAEEQGLLKDALRRARRARPRQQIDALRLLGGVGGGQAIEVLNAVLREDPSLDTRLEAASLLARLDSLPEPEQLVDHLSLRSARVTPLHRTLFRLLASSHPKEMFVLARSADLPPAVRALVIDALGWTEDFSALPLLETASADPHAPVRLAALDSASRLGHPGSAKWILPLLDDPEPPVRARAIRACQLMQLTSGLPAIHALRHDPSPWVRLRAQQAEQVMGIR